MGGRPARGASSSTASRGVISCAERPTCCIRPAFHKSGGAGSASSSRLATSAGVRQSGAALSAEATCCLPSVDPAALSKRPWRTARRAEQSSAPAMPRCRCRPHPSVPRPGQARLLSRSGPLGPRYCKATNAIVADRPTGRPVCARGITRRRPSGRSLRLRVPCRRGYRVGDGIVPVGTAGRSHSPNETRRRPVFSSSRRTPQRGSPALAFAASASLRF